MAISTQGIGSNLDVNGIVSQLMAVERTPLRRLDVREASFQARLSAFGSIQSALSTFQGAVNTVSTASRFSGRSATSSDATVATVTGSATAQNGSYALNVTQLAQAQSLTAAGRASTTAAIGSGASTELRFQFGTISGGTVTNGTYSGASFSANAELATKTVTIDSSNNSLAGIRDAINSAEIGVRASIVGDGSATPHRLVLQSSTTGVAASMKITVTGDADVASLLAYDPAGTQNLSQSVAAQNALLTVNGLAVSSASNKVTDAVDGATLNLLKTGTSNVTVSRDIASARSAVEGFVKAYNDLNTTLRNVSSSDAKTGSRAVLNGDPVVRNIQLQLRGAITGSLGEGLNLRTLSDVGIAFDTAGVLKVDSAKLNTALEAGPEDVSALFASSARPSDSLVSVKAQTSATKAGTYDLNVSTLATRGALVGSAAAATTITAGVNDSLTLDIDGTSAAVQLSAGSYTAATLATMVQAAINGTSAFSSKSIGLTVEQTGGILTLWSNRFGSASTVSVSGIGAADLLGGSPTATAGVDVAGSIGGTSGTGSGRVLTGASGSDVAGLQLEVQGETTGARGTVTVGTGFGAMINQLIDGYLGSGGVLAGRTTGLNDSIKEVGEQREVMNRRLGDIEKRYRAQFTSLDTMMSRMLQTSSYLTQQLSALQANT